MVTLLFALHNHQPDGNFDEVFAQAYDDCYVRILDALDAAPRVKCALHHTGPLLEWIEVHRADYFSRLRSLVSRGQVEILGGGFYEPMLAVLPERDAEAQIRTMVDYCQRHFGQSPRGMWLAERVWEPGLPPLLARAGVEFTLIDDGHFRYAGETGTLHGYYATEKAGTPIAIFPIDQKLRYAIPFSEPAQALQTIRDLGAQYGAGGDEVIVTYGDDGEKFGVWPGTKEWVWDKGWLREFFRLLGEASDVQTAFFGDVLARTAPRGRVYLPTASYEEMGEWALPAVAQERYHHVRHNLEERSELDEARPFLRGGIWQGFLAKYPEANFMHKKMVAVSNKVDAAIAAHPDWSSDIDVMKRELYRAQCNCSYWHGLFGGLYLNWLRDAVFRHLLVAEAFADGMLGKPTPAWAPGARSDGATQDAVSVLHADIDADLEKEVVLQSDRYDVTIRPHQGGTLQELAYRPKTFMLSNVLGRHEEGYHHKLRNMNEHAGDDAAPKSIHDVVKVKEPGLEKLLIYDRYPRYLFVDHFFARDVSLDAFADGTATEAGDFVGARYNERPAPDHPPGARLSRIGRVDNRPLSLQKDITLERGAIIVRYRLDLLEGAPLELNFAPELSLTLLDGRSPDRTYHLPDRELPAAEKLLNSRGAWRDVPSLSLVNRINGFRVDLAFGGALPSVWRFPLETVSMSEGGFERTYQGSVIVPLFPVRLAANQGVQLTVELRCTDL